MSNATAWSAPISACTRHAVLGVTVSPLIVATIRSSTSEGSAPARFKAFSAAAAAMDTVVSFPAR